MLFNHRRVDRTKRVLVHGAAGNVGAYAVESAKEAGAEVIGTAHTNGVDYVRQLGTDEVTDANTRRFEECAKNVDRTSSF